MLFISTGVKGRLSLNHLPLHGASYGDTISCYGVMHLKQHIEAILAGMHTIREGA